MEGRARRALLVCLWCLALAGASGTSQVKIFDLAYKGDDVHLLRWTFRTFTNFPTAFWQSGNSHRPCGADNSLGYQGVTCSRFAGNSLYVTRIDLSFSTLPPGSPRLKLRKTGIDYEIVGVLYLRSLNLDGHLLQGPLQPQLGLAPSLRELIVSNNRLSGRIPPDLCALNLTCLLLTNNNFTGKIPSCWKHIPCIDFENSGLRYIPGLDCDNTTRTSSCAPPQSIQAPPPPPAVSVSSLSVGAVLGIVLGILALLLLLGALTVLLVRRQERIREEEARRKLDEDIEAQILTRHLGSLVRFSAEELAEACNGFDEDNVVGEGGFSQVFKGTLTDGTPVAIKKIKTKGQQDSELSFLSEVELIGRTSHCNLIRCLGFCVEAGQCMLVLPFCSNGSVSSRTCRKEGDPLLWPARAKIALGTAEGLAYLHNDAKLIHRDIKAENVLLDDEDCAVIADFGLAKTVGAKGKELVTGIKGTLGFIAPEYFVGGECTEKTDVYAFGVFLLELITGKDFAGIMEAWPEEEDKLLVDRIAALLEGAGLKALLDPELEGSEGLNRAEAESLVRVALLCLAPDPTERPAMTRVAKLLGNRELSLRWAQWQEEAVNMKDVINLVRNPELWNDMTTGVTLEGIQVDTPR